MAIKNFTVQFAIHTHSDSALCVCVRACKGLSINYICLKNVFEVFFK